MTYPSSASSSPQPYPCVTKQERILEAVICPEIPLGSSETLRQAAVQAAVCSPDELMLLCPLLYQAAELEDTVVVLAVPRRTARIEEGRP